MSVGRSPVRVTTHAIGSSGQLALEPALAPLGLAEDPAVALGPQRAGADQDGIDLLAQAVEHRAIAVVAERA